MKRNEIIMAHARIESAWMRLTEAEQSRLDVRLTFVAELLELIKAALDPTPLGGRSFNAARWIAVEALIQRAIEIARGLSPSLLDALQATSDPAPEEPT